MSVRVFSQPAGAPTVHPTAVVEGELDAPPSVVVGPYAIVQGEVHLGQGVRVEGHAMVQGPADLADGCRVYPYAVVGTDPQDQKYAGERTVVRLGRGATLREFVTVNRGTGLGGGETVVGEGCYLMAHVHVAHDCRLGRSVVIANDSTLAGHVHVGDHAVFGGRAAVGQYVRVGQGAFVAAGAMLERDLPPFGIAAGDRARLRGVNLVGLRRLGLDQHTRSAVSAAYGLLLRGDLSFARALDLVHERYGDVEQVADILRFIRESPGGIIPLGH